MQELAPESAQGMQILLARRPTTAVLHHGGAPVMPHWMVLKRCAAGALMLARDKEGQAGDAAQAFEDN
jgi:hypothetical protein